MAAAQAHLLDTFFAHLGRAPHRVLLLDYDGTLAPFRVERNQAVPYPGVRDAIDAIISRGNTRVVVISGRAVADLLPLLGLRQPPEIWGSHGWEHRHADGRMERFPMDPSAQEGLVQGERQALEISPPDRVERKPGCIAVHWRGLNAADQSALRQQLQPRWEALAGTRSLAVNEFDGGLELRVPGRHKGFAVESVLQDAAEGTVSAYLGDDWTDEDAFRSLGNRGLSVLVRREHRPTAASIHLVPPEELLAFLHRWP